MKAYAIMMKGECGQRTTELGVEVSRKWDDRILVIYDTCGNESKLTL